MTFEEEVRSVTSQHPFNSTAFPDGNLTGEVLISFNLFGCEPRTLRKRGFFIAVPKNPNREKTWNCQFKMLKEHPREITQGKPTQSPITLSSHGVPQIVM